MQTTTKGGQAVMIASACKAMNGVKIEIIGTWVWCSGDTDAHKENLKELGFKKKAGLSGAWYWYSGPFKKRTRRDHTLPEVRSMFKGKHQIIKDEANS